MVGAAFPKCRVGLGLGLADMMTVIWETGYTLDRLSANHMA